jgi:hypothetical protein
MSHADALTELNARLHEAQSELGEVKAGYAALDKNWETLHEACMRSIREALGLPLGTVLELVQEIRRLKGGQL